MVLQVSIERVDQHLGTVVHVVGSRQTRPNLPTSMCPFCPGGLEAPDDYQVRWFGNRWPAMPDERCEVVLYTPRHGATFWSLGRTGIRRVVDLWADRTVELAARDDVEFVLVFENRGAEVGATIGHPHGQIYAYDHVPSRPHRIFAAGWKPDSDPGERLVTRVGEWCAYVPFAPTYPVALTLAPRSPTGGLDELSDDSRDDLAVLLADVFERLDRLYDLPLPYMMWVLQRPFPSAQASAAAAQAGTARYTDPWLQIEIVSPWRSAEVPRFIAAAEVSCEEYFNPVEPEELAARLRTVDVSQSAE